MRYILFVTVILSCLCLSGCKDAQPGHIENICKIFNQYPVWYWEAQKVDKNWGLPIHVLMAVIYQESRFNASAKPPRRKLLWVIPWFRQTSAYGYSQALKGTWRRYLQNTHHKFSRRDAFDDAADFVGWYADQIHKKTGISKQDAYGMYLAYHEGINGYQHETYLQKKWLLWIASKVRIRAQIYHSQLMQCQDKLPKKPFWRIW